MKIYLVCEDGYPSYSHSRYLSCDEAQAECDRITACDIAHNDRIEKNPATGKGSCFLNMKRKRVWTVKEIEVPN